MQSYDPDRDHETQSDSAANDLADDDGRALLELARRTITDYVVSGEVTPYHTDGARFRQRAAVFVTLRLRPEAGEVGLPGEEEGELRGCIGQIEAEKPLYLAVQDAAVKAATGDPRFYPVEPEELDMLVIEVSVLSAMKPVKRLSDIVIGRDGLLIVGNRRRGLLLPQVAARFGWDHETYIRNLCQKAGLSEDAWPERARLYSFTTTVFKQV